MRVQPSPVAVQLPPPLLLERVPPLEEPPVLEPPVDDPPLVPLVPAEPLLLEVFPELLLVLLLLLSPLELPPEVAGVVDPLLLLAPPLLPDPVTAPLDPPPSGAPT